MSAAKDLRFADSSPVNTERLTLLSGKLGVVNSQTDQGNEFEAPLARTKRGFPFYLKSLFALIVLLFTFIGGYVTLKELNIQEGSSVAAKPSQTKNETKQLISKNESHQSDVVTKIEVPIEQPTTLNRSESDLYFDGAGEDGGNTVEQSPIDEAAGDILSIEMKEQLYGIAQSASPQVSSDKSNKVVLEIDAEAFTKLKTDILVLQRQVASNDELLFSNQKSMAQMSQVQIYLNNELSKMKGDVKSLKDLINKNNSSIANLESKFQSLDVKARDEVKQNESDIQKKERVNSFAGNVTHKSGPVAENKVVPDTQEKITEKPRVDNQPVNNAHRIHELWIIAAHGNKAVLGNEQNKQFLVQVGQSYKNLGVITRISEHGDSIEGNFDNGMSWIITKR